MPTILNYSCVPELATVDVLVVGGGSAGCCAAIAAAEAGRRSGLRVGLVERYGFLGGSSTQTLDTFYGFFTPGDNPRKVVGGLPDRVVDSLDRLGTVVLRPNTYGAGTGVTYNPEHLKCVWDRMLDDAGVQVWLHATLVDATSDSSGAARSVIVHTKSGFFSIQALRFVDASGDADLCHKLNVPYEKAGDVDPAQTLTTTFRMANVAVDRYEQAGGKAMLAKRVEHAIASGTHPLPRKSGSVHNMVVDGCIATVAVRVADVDATDFSKLGDAEREGRRQALVYEEFFREMVPGYEAAQLIGLSHQIGVRESRRVYGNYRLVKEDCLTGRQFKDAVLLCGAPIEDHRPGRPGQPETNWEYVQDNAAYGVPYGTLVPRDRDELWVAGRCFSATHDAHASCRSMGQTMAMGQAAGLAAHLSLHSDVGAGNLPVSLLQDNLLERGAVLQLPDETADTAANCWKHAPVDNFSVN